MIPPKTAVVLPVLLLITACKMAKTSSTPVIPTAPTLACERLLAAMGAQYAASQLPARNWIELAARDYWRSPTKVPFAVVGFTLDSNVCQNDTFTHVQVPKESHVFRIRATSSNSDPMTLLLRFRVELTEPNDLTLFTPEFCLKTREGVFSWMSCGDVPAQ